jgi:hypothetical protein
MTSWSDPRHVMPLLSRAIDSSRWGSSSGTDSRANCPCFDRAEADATGHVRHMHAAALEAIVSFAGPGSTAERAIAVAAPQPSLQLQAPPGQGRINRLRGAWWVSSGRAAKVAISPTATTVQRLSITDWSSSSNCGRLRAVFFATQPAARIRKGTSRGEPTVAMQALL